MWVSRGVSDGEQGEMFHDKSAWGLTCQVDRTVGVGKRSAISCCREAMVVCS